MKNILLIIRETAHTALWRRMWCLAGLHKTETKVSTWMGFHCSWRRWMCMCNGRTWGTHLLGQTNRVFTLCRKFNGAQVAIKLARIFEADFVKQI